MTSSFDDIRPYQDQEVRPVLRRLRKDPELLNMVGRAQSPLLASHLPVLSRAFTRLALGWRLSRVDSVDGFQKTIAPFVQQLLRNTTSEVTWEGLSALPRDRACLFLSNHRDIVSDPSVVNYILFRQGMGTTRIAIGDNLTRDPLVADLMRLNKSFIVRRNLSSPREKRDTYMTLSSFIFQSIEEDNESVWLAQREGRAKDGIDRTDPAILKMLYMSQKKRLADFAEAMERLSLVPVTIAYEYDPCDVAKARELEARERTGTYVKAPGEDLESIIQGIRGHKGRVHVAFSAPLGSDNAADYESPQAAAEAVDRVMKRQYHLFPSNWVAARMLASRRGESITLPDRSQLSLMEREMAEHELQQRLSHCDQALHPYLLSIYANPVYRHPGYLALNPDKKE
ncbi:MAG: 1-acyl-sn-glycerol-3-phosphate acyltransferase [Oleiphilaceae bacterium]|nr:1-acyl-sn-glycerol-3-phosphate acyltransferase [Oleiphilaceae bacterium]